MKNNELLDALRSGNTDDISPRSRAEAIAIAIAIRQKMEGTVEGTDVSTDTVTAETLLEGVTAYNSDGKLIKGVHTCKDSSTVITDFSYFCKDGARIDVLEHISTSKGTSFMYMFSGCESLTAIPPLDTSSGTNFSSMFYGCSSLKDITFTGTINVTGINLSYSPLLTKASITSLVNALSSTASGQSVTVSQTAVNNAFTTDEWNALKATKSNWTITLKDSN